MQLRTVVAGPGCVSIFFNLLKLILRLCVVCRGIFQQTSTGVISGEGVIRRFSTNCHCAKKCQIETGCRFFQGQSHIFPRRHLQMLRWFQQDQWHGRYASKWEQNEHGKSHHTSNFLRPSSGTEMLLMWFSMPQCFCSQPDFAKVPIGGTMLMRTPRDVAAKKQVCYLMFVLMCVLMYILNVGFDVCFNVCINVCYKCMFWCVF